MEKASERREARASVLVPLGIIVLGILEIAGLFVLGHYTSVWWVLGVVLVGWIIGLALLVAVGQQAFVRLRSLIRAIRGRGDVKEHMSRPVFTLLAALCFFFPGILTDLAGLVLLVTPVQKKVARSVGLENPDRTRRLGFGTRRGSVIQGEIVVEPQRPTGAPGEAPASHRVPPVITQD